MDKKTIIISLLKEIDTDVLIGIWNTYCSDENMDDYIYENDDYNINEIFNKPDEALRAAFYGDYRYNHDLFYQIADSLEYGARIDNILKNLK